MRMYAVLMRLYPADYPCDEMLGVLEENGRPWYREAPALVVGALRARTAARQRVLYATRAAALMLLVASAAAPWLDLRYGVELRTSLTTATWVCAGLAAVAVVAGVRLVAFGLSAAALVLSGTDQISIAAIGGFTLATVLLLIPGPRLPVRNPLPVLLALAWAADYTRPGWVGLGLLVALALWTLIDERILLAAGLALFAGLITVSDSQPDSRGLLIMAAWHLGVPVALVTVAAVLAHRRAKVL